MSKTILIYGATGWLGNITLDYLNKREENFNLIPISKRKKEIIFKDKKLQTITPNEALKMHSLCIDYFFNYAFLTQEKIKEIGKDMYIEDTNNIINFYDMFCKNNKIKNSLLISSGAVYWEGTEKENLYALQKIKQENLFSFTNESNEIDFIIARVFSVIGNYYETKKNYAFVDFMESARSKNTIKLNSKKRVQRSYLYFDSLLDYFFETSDSGITIDAWNKNIDILDLANIISKVYDVNVDVSNGYKNFTDLDDYTSKNDYFKNIANIDIDDNLIKSIFLDK